MATNAEKIVSFPTLPPVDLGYTPQASSRVLARDIIAGALSGTAEIRVGDENIKLDPANRSIWISDGTYDRVHLGYMKDGY